MPEFSQPVFPLDHSRDRTTRPLCFFFAMRFLLLFLVLFLLFALLPHTRGSALPIAHHEDTTLTSWLTEMSERFKHHVQLRPRAPYPVLERMRFYSALSLQPKMKEPARYCNEFSYHTELEQGRIMFVAYKDPYQNYVIAFRQLVMTSLRNFWTVWQLHKAKCRLGDGNCGRVHSGFQNAYLKIRPRLLSVLRGARSVSFTGHSLGAAMAIMAAYDVKQSLLDLEVVPNDGDFVIGTEVHADSKEAHAEIQKSTDLDSVPLFDSSTGRPPAASPFASPASVDASPASPDVIFPTTVQTVKRYLPVKEVVVFGSPRIGNYVFEKAFAQNNMTSLRIVTTILKVRDPVTKLPPIFLGYSDPFQQTLNIQCASKMDFHSAVVYWRSLEMAGPVTRLQCGRLEDPVKKKEVERNVTKKEGTKESDLGQQNS